MLRRQASGRRASAEAVVLTLEGVQDTSARWSICLEISRDSKDPFTLLSQGAWSAASPLPIWLLVP